MLNKELDEGEIEQNDQNATDEVKNIRERLKNYLMSSDGEVPWQYDMIWFNLMLFWNHTEIIKLLIHDK